MDMYSKIEVLCKNKGITITDMCKDANISRGSLTDLKKGRIKSLSLDALRKISMYFSTTIDHLAVETDGSQSVPIRVNLSK